MVGRTMEMKGTPRHPSTGRLLETESGRHYRSRCDTQDQYTRFVCYRGTFVSYRTTPLMFGPDQPSPVATVDGTTSGGRQIGAAARTTGSIHIEDSLLPMGRAVLKAKPVRGCNTEFPAASKPLPVFNEEKMMTTEDEVQEAARRLRVRLEIMLDPEPSRMPPGLKGCSTCGLVKPLEFFYRFHRSRDGRLGRCKSCFLTRREELKRERDGGSSIGKSAVTPVTTISELRTALTKPEVFTW